jgi:hypothetical protein
MRRNLLLATLLPLIVVLGAAGGYLAAGVSAAGSTAPAHEHATTSSTHEHNTQPTPASGSTTAGHNDMPGMNHVDTASSAPAATDDHNGGHGSTGTGVPATTRGVVVTVFAATNVAILAAAALVRRRTRHSPTTRRPAARAA